MYACEREIELIIIRIRFHQIVLGLNKPKINYLGSDSGSLSPATSHVEPNCHFVSLKCHSPDQGGCRDASGNPPNIIIDHTAHTHT